MLNKIVLSLSICMLSFGMTESSFANIYDGWLTSTDAQDLLDGSDIVFISDEYTTIGLGAFENCTEIRQFIIPDSITSICVDSFEGCDNADFTVPSKAMKAYLCDICDISEDRVTVDRTLVSKEHAWKWPSNGIIKIPSSITNVDYMSFAGRKDIRSIEIPTSVGSINSLNLAACDNLNSITIPHWTSISDDMYWPPNLKVVNVKYVNSDMAGHANNRIINMLEASGISRWKVEIKFLDEYGQEI